MSGAAGGAANSTAARTHIPIGMANPAAHPSAWGQPIHSGMNRECVWSSARSPGQRRHCLGPTRGPSKPMRTVRGTWRPPLGPAKRQGQDQARGPAGNRGRLDRSNKRSFRHRPRWPSGPRWPPAPWGRQRWALGGARGHALTPRWPAGGGTRRRAAPRWRSPAPPGCASSPAAP